jgi:phosphoglycolate phosphatase-like HAD superfamily hydrolase
MVGDAGVDMEIAHLTGMVPVLVKDTEPDPEEFERHRPFHQIENIEELIRLIQEI